MQQRKHLFIYGFAIFAMFFGSGNLVFPLQIGQISGENWLIGFFGLFLTGIILPFLGLFVIKLHRGSYDSFFSEAGGLAKIILPLFTLSLLGAFGVVPRCITVAYGGISQIYPEIPLTLFSLIFCVLSYIFCLRDHLMIQVLGKWMTPILLISLTGLIILGVTYAPNIGDVSQSALSSFTNGFVVGYQTMDLFAAFFFSSLIFKQIQARMPHAAVKEVIKAALKPSIIGATLLALVYTGFVFLGAHYHSLTQGVSPERILPTIAVHVLGNHAALIIGTIVVFSCLTTAVALNNIYARYITTKLHLKQDKFPIILLGTTLTSFIISLLDFRGIAAFLAPVLEISYPSLILLTILGIFVRGYPKLKIILFYSVLILMLIYSYL
jgi:branched-chain amino acid:cation transporter, LIVCS family